MVWFVSMVVSVLGPSVSKWWIWIQWRRRYGPLWRETAAVRLNYGRRTGDNISTYRKTTKILRVNSYTVRRQSSQHPAQDERAKCAPTTNTHRHRHTHLDLDRRRRSIRHCVVGKGMSTPWGDAQQHYVTSGVTVGGMSLDDDDMCPTRTSRSSSVVVNGACFISSTS